jgi:hypothetical protein
MKSHVYSDNAGRVRLDRGPYGYALLEDETEGLAGLLDVPFEGDLRDEADCAGSSVWPRSASAEFALCRRGRAYRASFRGKRPGIEVREEGCLDWMRLGGLDTGN